MDSVVFKNVLEKISLKKDDFADIRGFKSSNLNFVMKKGELEETLSQKLVGAGIRVLANGAWGFVSTTEMDEKSLVTALKKAYNLAYSTGEKVKQKITTNTEENYTGKHIFKADADPRDYSIEEKYDIIAKGEKSLREFNPEIVKSAGGWEESIQRELIVNSNGTDVTTDYGIFRIALDATSRRADVIQNVSERVASSSGIKTIIKTDIEQLSEELGKRAITLLDAVPAPKGRQNLLLEPNLVGVFIHEAFGHASEGDAILGNSSVLRGKIGSELGIDSINVYDDPTIPGLRGSYTFDSEGTPAVKRDVVRDGKLVGYLNSLETSKRLSLEFPDDSYDGKPYFLNGAGRAQSFRHVSMPRMSNTYIGNGNHSLDELLETIGDGVYLQYSYGGYVQPVKGEFLFSSQSGYLIEDGEINKPFRNSAMSGLTLEVLQNIVGIGNDLDYAFQGVCGKPSSTGTQNLPVSAGGPHLAIKNITVGGI
ncbi:MAG: TldD/PmbA family protein [Candidatus Hodarchaeales archaeon]|jgi:TldD protein